MLNVVYEDNHIIVVIKPQNQPSMEDESKDLDLLSEVKEYIKQQYNKPGNVFVGLVHRLDRPTGGIMVFAKTSKAAERLSKQIRERQTKKVYYLVAEGLFNVKSGNLCDYLIKDEKNNIVRVVPMSTEGAKRAELEYKVLDEKDGLSLVMVTLLTGRSHQIRVQFANASHPIVGDQKYGKNQRKQNLALWAGRLEFTHPVTKEKMVFISPPDKTKSPWNKFYIDKYFVR